MTWKDKK